MGRSISPGCISLYTRLVGNQKLVDELRAAGSGAGMDPKTNNVAPSNGGVVQGETGNRFAAFRACRRAVGGAFRLALGRYAVLWCVRDRGGLVWGRVIRGFRLRAGLGAHGCGSIDAHFGGNKWS